MSPHKAEARLIGTILAIAAASCLMSAVGGLAAAATRGDWIVVAALALVPAGSGNDDEEEDLEVSILKSVEENGEEFLEAIEDDAELEEVYSALMDLIYEEDDAPEA